MPHDSWPNGSAHEVSSAPINYAYFRAESLVQAPFICSPIVRTSFRGRRLHDYVILHRDHAFERLETTVKTMGSRQ